MLTSPVAWVKKEDDIRAEMKAEMKEEDDIRSFNAPGSVHVPGSVTRYRDGSDTISGLDFERRYRVPIATTPLKNKKK